MVKSNLVQLRRRFEEALDQRVMTMDAPIEMLKPMLYSLQNGGKRLRPMMLLAILYSESEKYMKRGIQAAIALEFIHTYSLIHDDLPAMDDDDVRRGQPTNHIQFDEATAILAGDALLTDAFGLIGQDSKLKNKQKVKLVTALSQAAGSNGMVAGQLRDVHAQDHSLTLDDLYAMHALKTGKLFLYAIEAAIIIADMADESAALLREFGRSFGVAYQIHNDLIDQDLVKRETDSDMGGSDAANHKVTYVSHLGYEGAMDALNQEITKTQASIDELKSLRGESYQILHHFVEYIQIEGSL